MEILKVKIICIHYHEAVVLDLNDVLSFGIQGIRGLKLYKLFEKLWVFVQ